MRPPKKTLIALVTPFFIYSAAKNACAATSAPSPLPAGEVAVLIPARRPPFFVTMRVQPGMAYIPGQPLGGYARIGSELIEETESRPVYLLSGMRFNVEGWKAFGENRNWGVAFPVLGVFGVRRGVVQLTLAGGWNVFLFDRVESSKGVSLFSSPRAGLSLGVRTHHLYLGIDADAQYRPQWGGAGHAMYQLGLTIGFADEQPAPPR